MKNGLKKLLTLPRQWYKINLSPTKRKKKAVEFPIPAEITEMKPELVYDPYAEIVYNSGQHYYDNVPAKISADRITSIVRNEKIWSERAIKNEGRIDKVRDYLIENYDELEEHADEIASLLGIDLTNTVEVEFDVTVRATLVVPMGTSVDDLSTYDFDLEISYNGRDEIEIEDTNIDINSIDERQVSQQVGRCGGDNHINKNTTHTQEKI